MCVRVWVGVCSAPIWHHVSESQSRKRGFNNNNNNIIGAVAGGAAVCQILMSAVHVGKEPRDKIM